MEPDSKRISYVSQALHRPVFGSDSDVVGLGDGEQITRPICSRLLLDVLLGALIDLHFFCCL